MSITCKSLDHIYGYNTPFEYYALKNVNLKIEKGSGKPNKDKVATITKAQVEEIAKTKMEDLNAASIETAMSMVMGTARSMGVTIKE